MLDERLRVREKRVRHVQHRSARSGLPHTRLWSRNTVVDVSVIIPCRDAGEYALEAVASVASQTAKPREVLLADDGSRDHSVESVRARYPDVRIVPGPFGGASEARNAALREARGAFVAFLDADDRWDDNHLARALALLGERGDVAYLGHFDLLDERGARTKIPLLPELTAARFGMTLDNFLQLFLQGLPNGSASYVVRREAVEAIGGFDPTQLRANDLDFWLRLVRDYTWCYDPHPSVCYRMRTGGNLSQDIPSRSYFRLRAFLRLRDSGVAPNPWLERLIRYWSEQALRTAAIRGRAEDWQRAVRLVDKRTASMLAWGVFRAVRSRIEAFTSLGTARS